VEKLFIWLILNELAEVMKNKNKLTTDMDGVRAKKYPTGVG
jgi:hypothetical protein